jgi:hypothetical protein
MPNEEPDEAIPYDQQEDEGDFSGPISFKDAVVVNTDWTIETINLQINKGNIDLQPGFQRRIAWDDVRKSRLIESIIVSVPVPNIVLAENQTYRGKFIVIDGKQRLVSINEFLEGRFSLKGLDIRRDLINKDINSIPQDDRDYLENATLRTSLIRNWRDQNFLYTIFFRLNSGSLPLSPQELRRAMFGGHLLSAIDTFLIGSNNFQRLFGRDLDRRMRDSELVLRFIAFELAATSYRGDFRGFLDAITSHFESNWMNEVARAQFCFERLDLALGFCFELFGNNAFKKWVGDSYERVINRAIFDCLTRFFSDEDIVIAARQNQQQVILAYQDLCLNADFRSSIEKTTKSMTSFKTRINMWGSALAACLTKQYNSQTMRIV